MRRRVLSGINDLRSTHPDISKEAFEWDPSTVTSGSNANKLWKCKKGHIWSAPVSRRVSGSGCSICSNRSVLQGVNDLETTHPEVAKEAFGWNASQVTPGSNEVRKWRCSKNHTWTARIVARTTRNQKCPFCTRNKPWPGESDFGTTHPDLAKEADGWDTSTYLSGSGAILPWKCKLGHKWKAQLKSRAHNGNGCPICSGFEVLSGFNDLATLHPELVPSVVDWDPTKYAPASHVKKKWQCDFGHLFEMTISKRVWQRQGCPYCANRRLLVGFNDLKSRYPEIAEQAVGWNPESIVYGSNAKRRWKCSRGHIWFATVVDRTTGKGCRACANVGFNPSEDGWLYFLRHKEWGMLQIGISNEIEERLKSHRKLGWELIETRGPTDGTLVAGWERSILRYLKSQGAVFGPKSGIPKFDGYTEAWVEKSFSVSRITDLLEAIRNVEWK